MVTDSPVSPRPEISALAGNCFGSAWTGLGAGWELAGADWELAESNHYDEPRLPRTILDFSRRLGPAGGILGLACGPSGGTLGAIRRSRANPSVGILR